jgi:hypothetical protein
MKGRYSRLQQDPSYKGIQTVTIAHLAAFFLHFISTLALALFFLFADTTPLKGRLTSDVTVRESNGTVTTTLKTLDKAEYEMSNVLIFMPFITSVFHFIQWCLLHTRSDWFIREIKQGVNILRWIEYSITASLMTFLIAQLSGITNVYLVFSVGVVLNIALQAQGYHFEIAMRFENTKKIKDENTTLNTNRFQMWIPLIIGFIIFFFQWSIIACYFYRTVQASGDVPDFVTAIFYLMLILFTLFAIPPFLFARKWFGIDWVGYEIFFIVLSFVSKFVLDWTIAGGISNQ